jgi:stage V sporulation protein AA
MTISNKVFIKLRNKITITADRTFVRLVDVAQIVGPKGIEEKIKLAPIYQINPGDGNFFVIDAIRIIRSIRNIEPQLDVYIIGNEETLIEVEYQKKRRKNPLGIILVWVILFIGSGLAILNFHTDVSMAEVHQRIYFLITGEHKKNPLLLQIPYSIGIGIGMIVFFNQLFRKRINEEPSPLELEMYLYQENLDKYARTFENRDNRRGENESR